VLLFDEPLSNLDAKLRRRVREDIRDLQQNLNLTVVYVTHDQQEALAVSDRVIVMSNARIAQAGSPRALYESPASLFVADFMGDSNIVDAEILSVADGSARTRMADIVLELPARGLAPGPVKIAIRPEALAATLVKPDAPSLSGVVAKAAYLGTHMEYTVATAAGELFVVDKNVSEPKPPGIGLWLALTRIGVALVPRA
jgi:iron(III) transport system ATP-binding protein